jgi:putative heme iron utilization protein
MRAVAIPFAIWLGVLQMPNGQAHTLGEFGSLVSFAVALTGLTIAIYRLGVWREQMNNTKNNVSVEVARNRDESNEHFGALERRLTSIDGHIAAAVEQRAAMERWQGRVDATLQTHDRRLDQLGTHRQGIAA